MNRAELEKAVEIHAKTFALLKWINCQVRRGVRLFDTVHERMTAYAAAEDWLRRCSDQLPPDCRPAKGEIEAFAHFFVSYLATSFEVAGRIRKLPCGCYCDYCTYFVELKHVRARNPDRKARGKAVEIKARYVESLGRDAGAELSSTAALEFVRSFKELASDMALGAYGTHLIRRTHFASQGEGLLALWREFAWVDGRSNRKFELKAAAILGAEERVVEALRVYSRNSTGRASGC